MHFSEYVVNHGRSAFLGCFRNLASADFTRGDRVVVRTARGLETGAVLSEANSRFTHLLAKSSSGDIVRPMSAEDERHAADLDLLAARLLTDAQAASDELDLSITILDLEILLDGAPAILQVLPSDDSDLSPLVEVLSMRHHIQFAIQDLRSVPAEPEAPGCGKPGCGSASGGCSSCGTGGGCSTGSCSSGKVKNAAELTAYFADLRQKMEMHDHRVPLHG